MPDEITLAEYQALIGPGRAERARGASKGAKPGRGKGGAPGGAQALTASPVGSSFQGRLDKAAANGWHALESPDALRYRWRQNGGAVGPWGSYEEATKWGATHRPGEV